MLPEFSIMKKSAIILVIVLLAGCSSMGGGSMQPQNSNPASDIYFG
jgi:PBP1b-binding outer membrane lipoprotein LpoB